MALMQLLPLAGAEVPAEALLDRLRRLEAAAERVAELLAAELPVRPLPSPGDWEPAALPEAAAEGLTALLALWLAAEVKVPEAQAPLLAL